MTYFFIIKNGGIPYFLSYSNNYQQTWYVLHTNLSHQIITIYVPVYSLHTPLLYLLQTRNKYEAFSIAIQVHTVNDETFPSSKEQKSHVNITAYINVWMSLNLFLLFHFPWLLKLEELDPKLKTLQCSFDLVKDKLFHSYTSEIFKPEVKCSVDRRNSTNKQPHR